MVGTVASLLVTPCGISIISITTIGYGDMSSSSTGARLGTVFFVIIIGLMAFSMLIGIIADAIMEFTLKGQRGMSAIADTDHILIINFPNPARVRQVIRELGRSSLR